MISVLFICLGNICRSVTAEEIFRTLAQREGKAENFFIDSAGLIDYHKGELADSRMRQHASQHGYHLKHRSRPVTPSDFEKFDLIVAMDYNNVRGLKAVAPTRKDCDKIVMMADYFKSHSHSFVPDPYYGEAEDFELVIELLEDACQGLLDNLSV